MIRNHLLTNQGGNILSLGSTVVGEFSISEIETSFVVSSRVNIERV